MSVGTSLALYFALAYALAWVVWVPMVVFRLPPEWTILATCGPILSAMLTRRIAGGDVRAFR